MGPSLEENTVFNEGGRKQELPAAFRKVFLFSFASFPLFMGMMEAGPIHPHSIPSLGLMRGAPRPPQTKISPQTATHKHSPCWTPQLWGYLLLPTLRCSAAGLVCGHAVPRYSHTLTTCTPGAIHTAVQCQSFVIKEKPRHWRYVIHTWHHV